MLTDTIRQKMNSALKAGNKTKKSVYAALLDALLKFSKENKGITEEQEIAVLKKELNQTKETLEFAIKAQNTEMQEYCNLAIAIINSYLPTMLTDEQIKEAIEKAKNELDIQEPTKSDKGKFMKALASLRTVADMKQVSQLVDAFIAAY